MTTQKKIIWPADTEPILSILRHPKLTILFALKYKKPSYFIKVGIIGTFASSLMGFVGMKLNGNITLGDVVYSSFLTSIVLYFVLTALMAGIAQVVGAAFNGKGTFKALFRVFSLALVPYIWLLPILLFWMQISPLTYFNLDFTNSQMLDQSFVILGMVGILAASILGMVVMIQGISLVHNFSKWKGFAVFLMMLVVFAFVAMAIQMLFGIRIM